MIGFKGPLVAGPHASCCVAYGSNAEQVLQSMIFQSFMETTVGALNLSVPFAKWAVICDSDDVAKMHAAAGLKSLFCSVSKDDPSTVCAVQ